MGGLIDEPTDDGVIPIYPPKIVYAGKGRGGGIING